MDDEDANRWCIAMAICLLAVIMTQVIRMAVSLEHIDYILRMITRP